MTRENLVTVTADVGADRARHLLHKHRIEKLIVVDDAYRCIGLITVKDMDKAEVAPACQQRRTWPPARRRRHRCWAGWRGAGARPDRR